MIPIAGVLLLIIVVFTVAVVVSNPGVSDLSIFGASIPTTPAGVYFTGAGAMLVLILAAALMRRGIKRELARRRQLNELKQAAGDKVGASAGSSAASRPVPSGDAAAVTGDEASNGEVAAGEASSGEVPGSGKSSGEVPGSGGSRGGMSEGNELERAVPGGVPGDGVPSDGAEHGRTSTSESAAGGRGPQGGRTPATGASTRSGSGAHAVGASAPGRQERLIEAKPRGQRPAQQRGTDEAAPNPLAAGFGPLPAQSRTPTRPAGRDGTTSAAERQALLDEAEELAGDGPDR